MRHLFETGSEELPQFLDVIAMRFGRLEIGAIGHLQRAGEIIGQAHAGDGPRIGGLEIGGVEQLAQKRGLLHAGEVRRDLEEL